LVQILNKPYGSFSSGRVNLNHYLKISSLIL
jgi:hypothetical protein